MNKFMENGYMDHYLTRKQLEKLVVHDQLTGVYNRNFLNEYLNEINARINSVKNT